MSTLQSVLEELNLGPAKATPAALAAVTDLAIEIAREGREGRKIGTIFTIGAETEVLRRSRCLILDPLAGHGVEDQTAAALQDLCFGADREDGADLAALASFAGDLDCKVSHGGQRGRRCVRWAKVEFVEDGLQGAHLIEAESSRSR